MDVWTIKYGATTKSAADWGIQNLTRERMCSAAPDTVKFILKVQDATVALPFPYKAQLTIYQNGDPWFVGIVSKPAVRMESTTEQFEFELSGPWWHLEQIMFQQNAVMGDLSGGLTATMTTTQSDVTLGQSLDLTKLSNGAVIQEVLRYAQYAYRMVAFPTIVDVDHLPPLPDQTLGPFQIGTITPNTTGPYAQLRDKSCAAIIKLMMKYSPDCVAWVDYSTTPPTINIDKRSNLAAKTIAVLDGSVRDGFTPVPRYDLQVPVVVAKFQSHASIDGVDYATLTVDSYPAPPTGVSLDVWRSQEGAWVQTIDLLGASITYIKQTVSVVSRPTAASTQEQARAWLLRHCTTLELYDFSSATLASGKLNLNSLTTVVDPNSPALGAPFDMPADGTGYDYELLDGAVTPWMYDSDSLLCADATLKFEFTYTGTDDATLKYFQSQPTPGTLIIPVKCKITNAGDVSGWTATTATTEYTAVANASVGEPVPMGFAQSLYEALEQLHFTGTVTTVEEECSDPLPPGSIFNTTDGNAAWQVMNAMVLSVREDIDRGKTTVQFGPPLMLGLQEMEELFRANLGRLPSFKLNQRSTGKTSDGSSTIIGHSQSSASSSYLPPGGGASASWAFKVRNTSTGSTGQVQINGDDGLAAVLNGFVANVNGSPTNVMPFPQLAVTGNGVVYAKAILAAAGDPTITNLDIYFDTTLPANDATLPASYGIFLLATVTDYAAGMGGAPPTFTLSNASTGYSTLVFCGPLPVCY